MAKILMAILTFIGIATAGKPIKPGDPAYNFTLISDDGKTVKLEDYKGKWVVLYFYPKADTPGCTTQAKEYTKLIDEFRKNNIQVFGISTDDLESIRKFKQKHNLKVIFLSDPKGEVAKAYDVTVIFGLCSRNTVIINPEGKVEKIFKGVDPSADAKNVLSYITSRL